MSNRALSLLFDIKTSDGAEQRIIEGIATSPTVDRMGDVIEVAGVSAADTIPLLMNHDSNKLVGRASLGRPTARGIPFTAKIPKIIEPGTLRDRCEEAWLAIRYKLLGAVSIGFRSTDAEPLGNGGILFHAIEILELSLVPCPAQPDAVISAIRSGSAAARQSVIRSIRRPRGTATFDQSAHARMVAQMYRTDPRLRALCAQRIQRARAEARTPVAWRFAMLD